VHTGLANLDVYGSLSSFAFLRHLQGKVRSKN
jgi:hypothetical protein